MESHILRKEAALQSAGMAADTSASFGTWQQGEQSGARVEVVFLIIIWAPCRHLMAPISLMPGAWFTSPAGGFW